MPTRSAALSVAIAIFVCLCSPAQTEAQSSTQSGFTPTQVAGEYVCRWPRETERRVRELGKDIERDRPFGSDDNDWPRNLVLTSEGRWHARNQSGDFVLKGIGDDELQLKAARWARNERARLVVDRNGSVAIALYLSSWCGNDKFVHFGAICVRSGQPFEEEGVSIEASLPEPSISPPDWPPDLVGEMDGMFSCGLVKAGGSPVLMHAVPPVSHPKQILFHGREFWLERWSGWEQGTYEMQEDQVVLPSRDGFSKAVTFFRSTSAGRETLLEAPSLSDLRLRCYKKP
jgi:hypothetical protein